MNEEILLQVNNLSVEYPDGTRAVNSVSFTLKKGEILGIIGESGSGKSTVALSIMMLLPEGTKINGSIIYAGKDLTKLSHTELREIRGKEISLIFQDSLSSFDPVIRVGKQIIERAIDDGIMDNITATKKAIDILRSLGVTYPELRLKSFPHELSGGLRQRAFITMSTFLDPKILIADEPTTSLDVIAQKQLIDQIKRMKYNGISVIFITHDIALASSFCDKLLIIYGGYVMEYGKTDELIRDPFHPYTDGLINVIPMISNIEKGLRIMKGSLPNPKELPSGCIFWPRCDYAKEKCKIEKPPLSEIKNGRYVACFYPEEVRLKRKS
jgi:oligopeptide/dipeptide ABC transporter ATP-binding protein